MTLHTNKKKKRKQRVHPQQLDFHTCYLFGSTI